MAKTAESQTGREKLTIVRKSRGAHVHSYNWKKKIRLYCRAERVLEHGDLCCEITAAVNGQQWNDAFPLQVWNHTLVHTSKYGRTTVFPFFHHSNSQMKWVRSKCVRHLSAFGGAAEEQWAVNLLSWTAGLHRHISESYLQRHWPESITPCSLSSAIKRIRKTS